MKKIVSIVLICFQLETIAQSVGINATTPDPSAVLDISSDSKGVLLPRLHYEQRQGIQNPAEGLLVFDIDTKSTWQFSEGDWHEIQSQKNFFIRKYINSTSNPELRFENVEKYIFEINASYPTGKTLNIPQSIINNLCADDDGCKVTMAMRNFDNTLETALVSFNFSYNSNGRWRSTFSFNDFLNGADNNAAVNHVAVLFDNFYFTDGNYNNAVGVDNTAGFGIMKWTTLPATTICRLILED